MLEHSVDLYDTNVDVLITTKVTTEISEDGISIGFAGFGENTASEGFGRPIYIEVCDGIPKVYIWADINQEEPTHIISLEGARECHRKEDDILEIVSQANQEN